MAYFRKRVKGWQAQVEKLGVRASETFPTKAQAIAWATAKEAEITGGKRGEMPLRYVSEALAKYAEEVSPKRKGSRPEIIRLGVWTKSLPFRNRVISEVSQTDIAEWRDARLKEVTAATVNREWNLLHAVFQVARREWRWLNELPFRDVKRPPATRPRFRRIADDEITALCKALDYREDAPVVSMSQQTAVAFLFAVETAMRLGEVMGLTWAAVNVERRFVVLGDTKNGDRREVPLSARAVGLLEKMKGRDAMRVFGITSLQLGRQFDAARKIAAKNLPSLATLHFHDTRHEACTRLAKKLNVLELARMIGHRDLKSLMIYFNATAEEMAAKL